MHRKLRPNQVVPTFNELHNLLLGYYLGETDFKEFCKAFNTRIIVAEEWTHWELASIYVEIKAVLKKLRNSKDKSIHRDKSVLWECRSSLRYRMNKVCPTLFKVINQYCYTPNKFCEIGTKEECKEYILSNSCRKDLNYTIVPCIGSELLYEADHYILQGICLNKL